MFLLNVLVAFTVNYGGGFGGVIVGGAMPYIDNINMRMTPTGVKFSNYSYGIGGGGYSIVKKLAIGGAGIGYSQTAESPTLRADLSLGMGFFQVGYRVLHLKFLDIIPMIGIGGGGYTIQLRPKLADVDFDSLILNPGRTSSITTGGFGLAPQLMAMFSLGESKSFINLILQAGLIWMPQAGTWNLSDGAALLNGPGIKSYTPYLNLGVVFGGGV